MNSFFLIFCCLVTVARAWPFSDFGRDIQFNIFPSIMDQSKSDSGSWVKQEFVYDDNGERRPWKPGDGKPDAVEWSRTKNVDQSVSVDNSYRIDSQFKQAKDGHIEVISNKTTYLGGESDNNNTIDVIPVEPSSQMVPSQQNENHPETTTATTTAHSEYEYIEYYEPLKPTTTTEEAIGTTVVPSSENYEYVYEYVWVDENGNEIAIDHQ